MKIEYKVNTKVNTSDVVELYKSAGIKRPVNEPERIKAILENSNLCVTAWYDNQLIGMARGLTDFNYCCYIADLCVKKEYEKTGIEKGLLELTQHTVGDKTMLIMLSSTPIMDTNTKSTFNGEETGIIIKKNNS